MASRKSNRIELNEWKGKSNKKRRSTPDEAINIDDDTVVEDLFERPTPSAKKKSKKNAKAEQGSSSKKMHAEEDSGDKEKDKPEKKKKKKIKKDKGKGQTETAETSGKDSTISAHWFLDEEAKKRWLDGYASKQISFCTMISTNLIESMKLGCMEKLKNSSVWKILNPHDTGYPRLTRLFYLNLQQVEGDRMILSSKVAGQDIILNHSVFAKVLGCPEHYKVDDHPEMKEGVRLAKLQFFLPKFQPNHTSTSSDKQLTHTVFTVEAKILFTILMRCVIPKENSRELLSDKVLYVMHLIMQGYEIDLPELVMGHMLYSSTHQRNHILPYANLLPLFFNHFGISVKKEEKISFGIGLINEITLQRLGIVRTVKDEWKFQKSIPVEEIKIQKFARLKTLTEPKPSPSIPIDSSFALIRLESIEFGIDELKQGQLELCSEISKMKFMIKAMNSQMNRISKALKVEETSSEENVAKPSGSPIVSLGENLNADPSKESEHKDNEDSIESDIPLAERLIRIRKKAPAPVTSEDLFEDAGGETAQGSVDAEEEEKDASDAEDSGDEEEKDEKEKNEEETEEEEEEAADKESDEAEDNED